MSSPDRSSSARKRQSSEDQKKASQARENAMKAVSSKKKQSIWDKYSYQIIIGGFAVLVVYVLIDYLFLQKTKKLHLTPVIELDEIEAHNSEGYSYKLGPNTFFEGWTLLDAKKILNNQFSYRQQLMKCTGLEESSILEKSYDFREKHPDCVSPVIDQRNCSSSFAVASASAISDRMCLTSKQNIRLSAQHFLSCQEDAKGNECAGGSIASFLDFAKKKGVVDENCFEYKGERNVDCPADIEKCQKHYILDYCVANGVEAIKREIFKNGPIVGYMPIFQDFLAYKNGVYKVLEGVSKFQGGHAVKIIGWGQTEGEDYWIVENSWGESWGMKGFGHIHIGEQELYLDDYGFVAYPKEEKDESAQKEKETKAEETVHV